MVVRGIIVCCVTVWGLFGSSALAEDMDVASTGDSGAAVIVDASIDMFVDSDGMVGDAGILDDVSVPTNNAPANWRCLPEFFEDGVCDCGCRVPDRDCPRGLFDVCERSGCPEGQVPWEHRPTSCMRSACGDGWVDENLGEVCDDGEALNSGGCSADCQFVNPGWICGVRAEGCESDGTKPIDMAIDDPVVDASVPDAFILADAQASEVDAAAAPVAFGDLPAETANDSGGCSMGGMRNVAGFAYLFLLSGLMLLRRRKG